MLETDTGEFFSSILDSMNQQIAVIDASGMILWVNRAWKDFAVENGGPLNKDWSEVNYLDICNYSVTHGNPDATVVTEGMQKTIKGETSLFYFEYPCHSPYGQRWFMMRFRPVDWQGPRCFLVTHQNITERKLAEFRVQELANLDGLTGLANRRRMNAYFEETLIHAVQSNSPISVLLIDIDFFKSFNDRYGHIAGDTCLRRVSRVLKEFAPSSNSLAARYGGEEFAVILSETGISAAAELAEVIRSEVEKLQIPHKLESRGRHVTVSIGVATLDPPPSSHTSSISSLINTADEALYAAKNRGRNCVCFQQKPADSAPRILAPAKSTGVA